MKRPARALVLGKFLPPHAGHLHLVRQARAGAERVTVLVCSLAREPIAGTLRHAWMRELFPDLDVVHVSEELPSAPEDSPDFWPLWLDVIAREAGPVDVVFTSEHYGDELARRLGARHVCVDLSRATHPVSGTAVRADPLAEWTHVPAPVREHLCRRIAIVGPESVGKSTLAEALAASLGTAWVAEYGREHTDGMALPAALTLDDIEAIGREQLLRENAAARAGGGVLVCDTDSLTTALWSELYFGCVPPEVAELAVERRYALHLLLDTDLPWADDGTRHHEHARSLHERMWRDALDARGWPYAVVRGSGRARLDSALTAISAALPDVARWAARSGRPA